MTVSVHNPDQYMASLRQIIAQGRKRIGQCARDFSPNVFAGIHYIDFIRLCIPG